MNWIREASEDAIVLTVCNGASIAAEAGLLDGKDATTYFGALDGMQRRYPAVHFHHGVRFIDAGGIISTAGVSAGIDGAFHLVARLLGRSVASYTARHIEYNWTPEPYLYTTYSTLNPSLDERGRRIQQARIHGREGEHAAAIAALRELLAEDPSGSQLWYDLGRSLYATKDYKGGIKAYEKAAQNEALKGRAYYNAACCAALLGTEEEALTSLDRAVEAGITFAGHVVQDEDLESIRDHPRFKAAVKRMREPRGADR